MVNYCPVIGKELENLNQQTTQQSSSDKLHKQTAKSNTTSTNEKQLYVGSLSRNVTLDALYSLFGLKMTANIRPTSSISLPLNGKTSTHIGFAYIKSPDLYKLNC